VSIAFLSTEQPALHGAEGELVLVRIASDPRQLEEILEAVADLPFPVNPEIHHGHGTSTVEFPAYSQRVAEVREALRARGLPSELEA
jgi:hypothetical protein